MTKRTGVPVGNWAEQLAQRAQGSKERRDEAENHPAALASLWNLFDRSLDQANAALGALGMAGKMELRDGPTERRYCAPGTGDAQRFIAIVPLLSSGGHGRDTGAFVGTSTTRATMYLVPVTNGGRVGWQVAASGRPFDADVVHDLFLSVFADDPGATSRLSPLSGSSYFQTPWG